MQSEVLPLWVCWVCMGLMGLRGGFGEILITRTNKIIMKMKEFIRVICDDYKEEQFTKREWVKYGIVVPVVMLAVFAVAAWIEGL